jgi:hypothetical protein
MLDQLSGLPVIGWEASCRLSVRGIETGRLLAGIERTSLSPSRWSSLLDELDIPGSHCEAIGEHLPDADRVYVACEQREASVIRKVYLERDRAFRQGPGERLTILGYKWDATAHSGDRRRTTEYWILDHTDAGSSMTELRSGVMSGSADYRALTRVAQVLSDALTEALAMSGPLSLWRHRHMMVREEGGARASVAFNFYDSGLKAGALRNTVGLLADACSLDTGAVDTLFDVISHRELAWLAGGLGADGEPFLSIYCEASRDDAHQACYAADPALAAAGFSMQRGLA